MNKLQSDTIKALKALDYLVYKFDTVGSARGVPDLIALGNDGQAVFIEIKSGKDTLSTIQKITLERIRARGFKAYILNEQKDLKMLITELENENLLQDL